MFSRLSEPISLNEKSGIQNAIELYQNNRDKPWDEWLEFSDTFKRPGKQGLVGLLQGKEDPSIKMVFKLSQYVNYLAEHELTVMNCTTELADFCPHFCRAIGSFTASVDPNKTKEGNPFDHECKYPVEKEVLLLEHLSSSYKFYNYIKSSKAEEDVIFSVIKQTLLAVAIGQKLCNLSHYDLHSNNIMIKKCSRDLVFLYILDDKSYYCVPSHGSYPVLIDYGFSYSDSCKGEPLWASMNHTDVGFLSDRFDPIADPKLFLVTVAGEVYDNIGTKKAKKLKNIVKNNYYSLNLDWGSGWDNDTKKCANDYVLELVNSKHCASKIFREYEYYCIDLITSLITLPLEKQNISELKLSYDAFTFEYAKIEMQIKSPYYCLYILKGIVDTARAVKDDYMNEMTRDHAVSYFRFSINERIDSIAKFCVLKDIHYERMLCSLLCLSRCVQGVLYESMTTLEKKKKKQYSKIPLKSPEEIEAVIDINIPDNYVFNEDTTVMVVDCVNKNCRTFSLEEPEIAHLNTVESVGWGEELYKIFSSL